MQDRVCLVTGANRGIGREIALDLARRGATVLAVCRTRAIAEATRDALASESGNTKIEAWAADFLVQAEVRQLVVDLLASQRRLDVLVNNAGAYFPMRTTSADGYEATFAVNHLAPFILTNGLLDLLRASAPARVIIVASEAHQRVRDPEDWESRKSYTPVTAYSRSKLANVMFGYDLAHRLEGSGVTVNSVHPGNVSTPLLEARFNRWWNSWVWPIVQRALITPTAGARGPVHLATAPALAGVTGQYYNQLEPGTSSLISHDAVIGARLWNISLRMTGVLSPAEITGEHIAG